MSIRKKLFRIMSLESSTLNKKFMWGKVKGRLGMNESQETLSEKKYKTICKVCNEPRYYKNKKDSIKNISLPCRSCSNSISRGGTGNVKGTNGLKKCIDCKKNLHIDFLFYVYPNGRVHSTCKKCSIIRSNIYHKEYYRFKKYGIDKNIFEALKKKQNNVCKICLRKEKLYIDHNHITNEIRGLLCMKCNAAMGLLKEDLDIINNLVQYIKEHA